MGGVGGFDSLEQKTDKDGVFNDVYIDCWIVGNAKRGC